MSGERPWIILNTKDGGSIVQYRPIPESPFQWNYQTGVIYDEGTTRSIVGQPVVVDVDGDGYNELFFASYFEGKVFAYTYRPQFLENHATGKEAQSLILALITCQFILILLQSYFVGE